MTLFEELTYRGLIKDCSDLELAKELLDNNSISFYTGFDPTGQSLTIGHLVQIVRMRLLQSYGHTPVVLVGGATGLIGDPRPTEERKLLSLEESLSNANLIKKQMSNYFDISKVKFVNNYDWIKNYDAISFLRDVGKYFSINYMLDKEIIASRLNKGISYTEFSYMLIQSIDFYHLYKHEDVQIQFGGSDQWGNITSGLDYIRKLEPNSKVVGLSSPLLTKSDGTKFGKSESGTVWLDENLTSPYSLYQYCLNIDDINVIKALKFLTLLSIEKIEELITLTNTSPEKREAQKTLAFEVVKFVHGEKAALSAINITLSVFEEDLDILNLKELKMLYSELGCLQIKEDIDIISFLVESKIASSKREAKEFIQGNAISINKIKIVDSTYVIKKDIFSHKKYILVKKGKKTYYMAEYL